MWLLSCENSVWRIEDADISATSDVWVRSIVIVQLWYSPCRKFNIWISFKNCISLHWQEKDPTVTRYLNSILTFESYQLLPSQLLEPSAAYFFPQKIWNLWWK